MKIGTDTPNGINDHGRVFKWVFDEIKINNETLRQKFENEQLSVDLIDQGIVLADTKAEMAYVQLTTPELLIEIIANLIGLGSFTQQMRDAYEMLLAWVKTKYLSQPNSFHHFGELSNYKGYSFIDDPGGALLTAIRTHFLWDIGGDYCWSKLDPPSLPEVSCGSERYDAIYLSGADLRGYHFKCASFYGKLLWMDYWGYVTSGNLNEAATTLGIIVHLAQDLAAVPQHAKGTIDHYHREFEDYLQTNFNSNGEESIATAKEKYIDERNGICRYINQPIASISMEEVLRDCENFSKNYFETVKKGGENDFHSVAKATIPYAIAATYTILQLGLKVMKEIKKKDEEKPQIYSGGSFCVVAENAALKDNYETHEQEFWLPDGYILDTNWFEGRGYAIRDIERSNVTSDICHPISEIRGGKFTEGVRISATVKGENFWRERGYLYRLISMRGCKPTYIFNIANCVIQDKDRYASLLSTGEMCRRDIYKITLFYNWSLLDKTRHKDTYICSYLDGIPIKPDQEKILQGDISMDDINSFAFQKIPLTNNEQYFRYDADDPAKGRFTYNVDIPFLPHPFGNHHQFSACIASSFAQNTLFIAQNYVRLELIQELPEVSPSFFINGLQFHSFFELIFRRLPRKIIYLNLDKSESIIKNNRNLGQFIENVEGPLNIETDQEIIKAWWNRRFFVEATRRPGGEFPGIQMEFKLGYFKVPRGLRLTKRGLIETQDQIVCPQCGNFISLQKAQPAVPEPVKPKLPKVGPVQPEIPKMIPIQPKLPKVGLPEPELPRMVPIQPGSPRVAPPSDSAVSSSTDLRRPDSPSLSTSTRVPVIPPDLTITPPSLPKPGECPRCRFKLVSTRINSCKIAGEESIVLKNISTAYFDEQDNFFEFENPIDYNIDAKIECRVDINDAAGQHCQNILNMYNKLLFCYINISDIDQIPEEWQQVLQKSREKFIIWLIDKLHIRYPLTKDTQRDRIIREISVIIDRFNLIDNTFLSRASQYIFFHKIMEKMLSVEDPNQVLQMWISALNNPEPSSSSVDQMVDLLKHYIDIDKLLNDLQKVIHASDDLIRRASDL